MTRLFPLIILAIAACGSPSADTPAASGSAPQSDGLTEEQIELGIGPVKSVELADIDPALSARGAEVFQVKCSACHKMGERYVGPALGRVATERAPEYIMNMILNTEEMIAQHPRVKTLLAEHMTLMPNQHLTEDEARAVLEFLRTEAAKQNQ